MKQKLPYQAPSCEAIGIAMRGVIAVSSPDYEDGGIFSDGDLFEGGLFTF